MKTYLCIIDTNYCNFEQNTIPRFYRRNNPVTAAFDNAFDIYNSNYKNINYMI